MDLEKGPNFIIDEHFMRARGSNSAVRRSKVKEVIENLSYYRIFIENRVPIEKYF